jgi:predicted kinase
MKKQPAIILVLGLPGSGKTTLAQRISKELGLPLLVKDDIKVILFDVYGWKDREESKKAGTASYKIMDYVIEEQLRCGNSLVVEGTFNPIYDDAKFKKWQGKYSPQYTQIYCYADADTIRQRFRERAAIDSRHVSHIEGEEGLQNLENYLRQGVNPPGIGGPIIEVDTTDFSKVNEDGIVEQLRKALNRK